MSLQGTNLPPEWIWVVCGVGASLHVLIDSFGVGLGLASACVIWLGVWQLYLNSPNVVRKREERALELRKKLRLPISAAAERKKRREHLQGSIRARDANFFLGPFQKRMHKVFCQLMGLWPSETPGAAGVMMSDGVFERFRYHFHAMKAGDCAFQVANLVVQEPDIVKTALNPKWETFSLRFHGTWQRVWLDPTAEGGKKPDLIPFHEIWEVSRRLGTQTLTGSGLAEGSCPNCETPVSGGRTPTCSRCTAPLRAGLDWVLTSIQPVPGWSDRESPVVEGLRELQDADLEFCPESLQDFIMVLFFRLQRRVHLTKEDDFEELLLPRGAGLSVLLERAEAVFNMRLDWLALEQVRVVGVRMEEEATQVLVRFEWSGGPPGSPTPDHGRERFAGLILLARSSGSLSDPTMTLNGSSTGAVDGASSDGASSDGASSDGASGQNWKLAMLWHEAHPEVTGELEAWGLTRDKVFQKHGCGEEGLSSFGRDAIAESFPCEVYALRWLKLMMDVDGVPTETEWNTLRRYGSKLGLTAEDIEDRCAVGWFTSLDPVTLEVPLDINEGIALFRALYEVAVADRELTYDEKDLLILYGARVSLRLRHVEEMILRMGKEG